MPIGKVQMSCQTNIYVELDPIKWIVAMISHGSSCLQYLQDLLIAIKSFCHPSNTGMFQEIIIKFLLELIETFVLRLHLLV